ncbi:hypothetical protein PHMEG_00012167 [Phytophthora megakarya]|uniref:PiggyBac transposable element-derived protein domain-containing protein n=1 Tax=Phytophthora megakarya TaxID=4795 RepID=A0A225WB41_9STRA|nr:hypothetical protein PHMEG_00012167 [Phytophthora megakarya]
MLNPMTRRFSQHWAMTEEGAIPAGIFGKFMAHNRYLHFIDNEPPRVRDKLWKLRPVIDTLQSRFMSGWTLPSKFSFDEGVLPATTRRNTTRMFMPDKPLRYGTKLFMVCDSETAYCHRKAMHPSVSHTNKQAVDSKTGAAAVVRNMKVILRDRPKGFRLVVIDRFYSSVALALQLLAMSIYVLGTIQINRIGYDKNIVERRKTRPHSILRGSFAFSRATSVPRMVACHWWDRKPVHYLATGPSKVKCPKVISDYQRWMGAVDVHDQLRLQSYSIQTTFRFQKYYKSLFMGFLDMALDRGDWYLLLHKQLLQLKSEVFVDVIIPTPSSATRARKRRRLDGHSHIQFDDWVTVSGVQKRRQRSCKVCALLRGETKKSFQTTYYCDDCSRLDAKSFLCPKARRVYGSVSKTCYQIWHEDFDSGASIPEALGKRILLRRSGKVGSRNPT